jgi:hypothetical protein
VRSSKTVEQMKAARFVASFTEHFQASAKIPILETTYTPAQIAAIVKRQVDAGEAVEQARGVYAKAVQTAAAVRAEVKPVYDGARQFAMVVYGANPAVLSALGLAPRKVGGPKDIATKQAAVEQMRATREARHTKGKRQKEKIKGVVPEPAAPEGPGGPLEPEGG